MNTKYEEIITRIQQNDATLTHVNFRQQNLTSAESESVFKALEENTQVTHLEFLGNNSSGKAAIAMGVMLSKNNTIVQLELGTNQLNNEDLQHIVLGLIHNSSVRVLDLNSNSFDNGEPIASLLEQNRCLQEIELSNSELSETEFVKIYNALVKNEDSALSSFNVYWPQVECLQDIETFIAEKSSRTGFGYSL